MNNTYKKLILYWLPLFSYVSIIFILSSLSNVQLEYVGRVPDKLLHFVEYMIFATLVVRALHALAWTNRRIWAMLLIAILATALVAVLDEYYQSTVPGRVSDFYDWVADVTGGLSGSIIYLLLQRILIRLG